MKPFYLEHLAVWHHTHSRPKARVLLIHGMSEHSGRHTPTVDFLLEKNIEVVRFDLRGAGLSGGEPQWVERFEDYVLDATAVFNWVQANLSTIPLFVLGHSLGGAIAVHFASYYHSQLWGLALSAPAYLLGGSISPLKIWIGKLTAKIAPHFRMPNNSSFEALSREPKVVEEFAKDPLCYHFTTLQQGTEILKALEVVTEKIKQIKIPLFMVHGTADTIVQPYGSYEVLMNSGSLQKELHYLPGVYHEPHNDLGKENYFLLLENWLNTVLR